MSVTQLMPRVVPAMGYSFIDQPVGVSDSGGGAGVHPAAVSGTIKSLTVRKCDYIPVSGGGDYSAITLYKNGVSTGLQVLIRNSDDQAYAVQDVAVTAGDSLYLRVQSQGFQSYPGYTLGLSAEWESPTAMIFGISGSGGSVIVNEGFFGGALGNGNFQAYAGGTSLSNSYSICALDCSVTRLMLQRYAAQVGGSWVGRLIVNNVLQDGSGGTVDTTVTATDAGSDTVYSDFLLPLTKGDRVDVAVLRTGTGASFAGSQIAVGVAVAPTNAGEFMFTGGSNNTIVGVGTTWQWNTSFQGATDESQHTAPVGRHAFTVTGMLVDHAPDSGIFSDRLLRNGSNTNLLVNVVGPDTGGEVTATEAFSAGDSITIEATGLPGVTNVGARLHWGIGATTETIPDADIPPPEIGSIGPYAWVEWSRNVP